MKKKIWLMLAILSVFSIFALACEKKIKLSADASTAYPGDTVQLSCNVSGATFELTQNKENAQVSSSGLVTINNDAQIGTVIKAVAKKGGKTSNSVQIEVVQLPSLESITISPAGTQVSSGGKVMFSAALYPHNTSERDITWKIVQNEQLASIDGQTGVLSINEVDEDDFGSIIKVQAERGSIKSNVSEVTISLTSFNLLNKTVSEITLKNTDVTAAPVLNYGVITHKGANVNLNDEGLSIHYSLSSSESPVAINAQGTECSVTQRKHGNDIIYVALKDLEGNIHSEDQVSVTSIKTPGEIFLPEYLSNSLSNPQRLTEYSVGKDQFFDFKADINDSTACNDFDYTFELLEGGNVVSSGDEVGVAQDGQIKFNVTGKVKVTITTASGNEGNEKSKDHIFDVNDFINISTWEDFKTYMEGGNAGDTRAVNFVVTSKPLYSNGEEYATFSLVPKFILNGGFNSANLNELKQLYYDEKHTGADSYYYLEHIFVEINDKHVAIRGNNHIIDFSKMGAIQYPARRNAIVIQGTTQKESNEATYLAKAVGLHNATKNGSTVVLGASEYTQPPALLKIDISNLIMQGNMTQDGKPTSGGEFIDSANTGTSRNGTHDRAIVIGDRHSRTCFEVNMNYITLRNFTEGISAHRVVNDDTYTSRISNSNILDMYSFAYEFAMTQIELNNTEIGFTGAGPIETLHRFSNMAGMTENEQQTITFTGFYNPGMPIRDTQYYLDYRIEADALSNIGVPVTFSLLMNQAVLTSLNNNQKRHIVTADGAYFFAGLMLNSPFYDDELISAFDGSTIIPSNIWQNTMSKEEKVAFLNKYFGEMLSIQGSERGDHIGTNYSEYIINTGDGVLDLSGLSSDVTEDTKNTTDRFTWMDVEFNVPLGGIGNLRLCRAYVVNAQYIPQE